MKDLFNVPPPPHDARPFIRLARITAGHKYQFGIVSDRLYSCATHFHEGDTSICIGESEGCVLCADGHHSRWSAFLVVCTLHDQKQLLLSITAGAYRNCPELAGKETPLRGRIIVCERMGKRNNSPLKVELQRSPQAEKVVARLAIPDVPAALCRLWKLNIAAKQRIDDTQDESAHKAEEVLASESEAQDEPAPVDLAAILPRFSSVE